eukprot:1303131-Amphidinium_carterae.1
MVVNVEPPLANEAAKENANANKCKNNITTHQAVSHFSVLQLHSTLVLDKSRTWMVLEHGAAATACTSASSPFSQSGFTPRSRASKWWQCFSTSCSASAQHGGLAKTHCDLTGQCP